MATLRLDRGFRIDKQKTRSQTGGAKIENNMIRSICRLFSLDRIQNTSRFCVSHISTLVNPLQFKASPALWAEPLKKKKKIDPAITKMREEKRKKKIMKEIRKLQRQDRQLKPLAEYETPICLTNELGRRKRSIQVSDAVAEERILLLKQWSRIGLMQSKQDFMILSRLRKAQEKALNELRIESEELYQAAVKIDSNLVPFKYVGPPETPPKEDYPLPDGSYTDVSRKWD